MFLEIIKAILMGIVEGITEWLPISSTGHMILLEQVVKFNASEEFMSMFRVLGQAVALRPAAWPRHLQAQRLAALVQGGRRHPAGAGHQPAGRLDGGSLL